MHLKRSLQVIEIGNPQSPKILIVDDEAEVLNSLADLLRKDFHVFATSDVDEALRLLVSSSMFSVVISDQRMPVLTGAKLLANVAKTSPDTARILLTGYADIDAVIEAVNQAQIVHYITKPWDAVKLLATINSIQRAKRSEHEKAMEARQWHTTFDAITEAVCLLDSSGRILRSNAAFRQLVKRRYDEIIGHFCCEVLNGIADYFENFLAQALKSSQREKAVLEVEGRWFQVSINPVLGESGVVVSFVQVMTDITERKLAEEELKAANLELSTVNRIIVTSTGTLGTKEMLDKILLEALEIVGLEGGTVCLLEPDDTLKLVTQRETSEATIHDLTNNRIKVGDCLCGNCAHDNCPLILADRQAIMTYATREALRGETINFHAAFPFSSKGKCVGVLCVFTSTEKKPNGRSLKLLETLTAQVALAIENALLYEQLQQNANELEQRIAERTKELLINRAELTSQNKELLRTYHKLETEASERMVAMEELRKSERMLIHQSRLAALGEMIGNIAHQWRQPLNMLGLLAQDLSMTYKKGEFSTEYFESNVKKVLETIAHMSKTIDDFMYFFSPNKEKIDFKVLEIIEKTIFLLKGSIVKQQVRIEVIRACDPVVNGYPNEFSQVLLNILFNARDAFMTHVVTSPTITIEIDMKGGRCVVIITDNAGGIPEEIIDRIFDPYFTTKGPDKGTGIGLFMSKTIIEKNMGGSLSASNVEGGAQFRIVV
jgi:PAS domain S-box-containing protein